MNIEHLLYFKTLASIQHYAKSAEELHISASTLSYAIKSLEQSIGFKLFSKQGRNICLSYEGSIFLDYVDRAICEINEGINRVKDENIRETHTIRLSAYRLLMTNHIVQRYKRATGDNDTFFIFNHQNTKSIINSLKKNEIDIGICSSWTPDPELAFFPLVKQDLVAIVPINHKLAKYNEVSLEKICHYPVIIPFDSDDLHLSILNLFEQIQAVPVIASKARSCTAATNLAANNAGIGIVLHNPTYTSKIKEVQIVYPQSNNFLYLTYLKKRRQSFIVSAFLEYLFCTYETNKIENF